MPFGRPDSWPALDALLEASSGIASEERFIPRNFLLDERVSPEREALYRAGVERHMPQWRRGHEEYLAARVLMKHKPPETFTAPNAHNLLPSVEPRQHLVRLERAESVAQAAGLPLTALLDLAREVVANRDAENKEFGKALRKWLDGRDRRPSFSGFWDDVEELFEPDLLPDWADVLRDRLGQTRFTPTGGNGIPVLLFRYPVQRVLDLRPKIPGAVQLLAVPTVLDSRPSPAFCPAPREAHYGRVLDLSDGPYHLRCEVLHPRVDYQARDLFLVGEVKALPSRSIPDARKLHLELLRVLHQRPNYALNTDSDLL